MQKRWICFVMVLFCMARAQSQAITGNVVIVTFDGLRWQELFGGADEVLVGDKSFTADSAVVKSRFWAETAEERRARLLPFIWSAIAKEGQLYGNRHYGNYVNVKNPYWISYPGYNELFTGYPDLQVSSNDKKDNKNVTVLEYLQQQPVLSGHVAAFASWDVFNYIFNEKRCGFPVNAGIDPVNINTSRFALLNEMQQSAFLPFGSGIRPDLLTYYLAKEYLLLKKPKVLFIGFDDTDDWAHNGKYDYYLQSANLVDAYLADLWKTLQSLPEYRDNTTLILTTDHGRGDEVKKDWTSHGNKIAGANQVWMAFLGKGIVPKGEVKEAGQLYQSQLAQTIAQLLGYTYTAKHPVDEGIKEIITR